MKNARTLSPLAGERRRGGKEEGRGSVFPPSLTASVVKYLQHAEWRPYKLEPIDVPFACRALSLGLKLDVDPLSKRNIRVIYRKIFQRMMRGSRYRDAFRLILQSPRCALLKPRRLPKPAHA